MKRVLVPLAEGFEEIEGITIIDILRRAGAEVTVAGLSEGLVEGRSRIKMAVDTLIEDVKGLDFDMIVLPGGAVGAKKLKKDERVREVLEGLNAKGRLIAAICAAPTVLSDTGVTKGMTVTSHPSVREELKYEKISEERVVADKNIITSQGPGTAMEFAFKLVEALFGPDKVREVNSGVLANI